MTEPQRAECPATFGDKLETLVANGFHPLPIVPAGQTFRTGDRDRPGGKTPGRLRGTVWLPMAGWERFEAEPPSLAMRRIWASWLERDCGTPNIGLVLGGPENLIAIDVDALSEPLAKEAARLAEEHFGTAPVRIGRAPKRLFLLRCTEPATKLQTKKWRLDGEDNVIEMLATGQQFVADGMHPQTNRPYEWHNGSPIDVPAAELPAVDLDQVRAFMSAWNRVCEAHGAEHVAHGSDGTGRGVRPVEELTANADQVLEALGYLTADYADDRATWIRVGHALRSATRDFEDQLPVIEAWHDFSALSDKYDQGDADDTWFGFDVDRITSIGSGTIFHYARECGWDGPRGPEPEDEFGAVPEAVSETLGPIESLNQEYAFVLTGGGHHILWEKTDEHGRFKLEHLNEGSFHKLHAARTVQREGANRPQPLTQLWMGSKNRRTYEGLCFRPGCEVPATMYNLWRGFAVEPADIGSEEAQRRCGLFLRHLRENVCQGDAGLFQWVVNWMAHLVQHPDEKPEVALVLRGGKGVGKTIVASVLGRLLGSHYLLTANRRFLTSNFNGHMESLLLLALDEAFWSGDKAAEGVLKDLITGSTHLIEHKGKEPYTVENLLRIIIIGNEEWLVPASADERRFAVLDVGEARKQDHAFFADLWREMDDGGAAALLRYLRSVEVKRHLVRQAPLTDALADQKEASQDLVHQWLRDSLEDDRLLHATEDWPEEVAVAIAYEGFTHYCRKRNVRSRLPDKRAFGKQIQQALPSTTRRQVNLKTGERPYFYRLPPLAQAKEEWKRFVGRR
jgi:hypothetical protein